MWQWPLPRVGMPRAGLLECPTTLPRRVDSPGAWHSATDSGVRLRATAPPATGRRSFFDAPPTCISPFCHGPLSRTTITPPSPPLPASHTLLETHTTTNTHLLSLTLLYRGPGLVGGGLAGHARTSLRILAAQAFWTAPVLSTVYEPGSVTTISIVSPFVTRYPLIRISSSGASGSSVKAQPSFCTLRPFTESITPGPALITSAPSSSRSSISTPAPSTTRVERLEILPPLNFSPTSSEVSAKEGSSTIAGMSVTGMPNFETGSALSMEAPDAAPRMDRYAE
mmetsp:Transcript_106202/g.307371  ORF Transcript_106202/g.307371 Transcript_106202/m.307371 type:complete len:282 (+) Transcript_106202:676-1521(+)